MTRVCRVTTRTSTELFIRFSRRPHELRGYATIADLGSHLQPGQRLHGFTVKRSKIVPELELTAFHLQHDKTGAEYLHVARDDKNNVFSVGFKTNPPDRTGLPHILEHLALCGSEKSASETPSVWQHPDNSLDILYAIPSLR